MQKQVNITAKYTVITLALIIVLVEVILLLTHQTQVVDFVSHYFWLTPVVFFKSFLKKFLLLNLFGVLKIFSTLLWHIVKLLVIKLLKTFGVRYGTFFSSRRWQKSTQRLRIAIKYLARKHTHFKRFLAGFNTTEYALILVAYFPLFLILFLCGFSFRLTKKAMASEADLRTEISKKGLIGILKRLDLWILTRIDAITRNQKDNKVD